MSGSSAAPAPTRLRHLARVLRSGGIVAHPTEGVFGLGCDPCNPAAVARLVALKRRASDKGLILLAACIRHLADLVHGPELERIPPAGDIPTTWVVRAGAQADALLTGGRTTVAVRICGHPVTARLLRCLGGPIVSSSANLTGAAPVMSAFAARARFATGLDDTLCAAVGGNGRPSRIIDLATGRVLRS